MRNKHHPDARTWNLDQLLDLTALDAGEFFNYIESVDRDSWFGWPNVAHWYTYRKHHIYEIITN